jgi:hypothetical protein
MALPKKPNQWGYLGFFFLKTSSIPSFPNGQIIAAIYLSIYLSIIFYYIIKTVLKEDTMFAVGARNSHINQRKRKGESK